MKPQPDTAFAFAQKLLEALQKAMALQLGMEASATDSSQRVKVEPRPQAFSVTTVRQSGVADCRLKTQFHS